MNDFFTKIKRSFQKNDELIVGALIILFLWFFFGIKGDQYNEKQDMRSIDLVRDFFVPGFTYPERSIYWDGINLHMDSTEIVNHILDIYPSKYVNKAGKLITQVEFNEIEDIYIRDPHPFCNSHFDTATFKFLGGELEEINLSYFGGKNDTAIFFNNLRYGIGRDYMPLGWNYRKLYTRDGFHYTGDSYTEHLKITRTKHRWPTEKRKVWIVEMKLYVYNRYN